MPSGSITLPVNTIELTPEEAREWNTKFLLKAMEGQSHPFPLLVNFALNAARATGHGENTIYFRNAYRHAYRRIGSWGSPGRGFARYLGALEIALIKGSKLTEAEWQAAAFTEGA